MRAVIGCLFTTFSLVAAPFAQANLFDISEHSRAHHPGEVLRLVLSTRENLDSVSVQGLGRSFAAYRIQPGEWQVLVGIDLNLKPGRHDLMLQGEAPDGTRLEQSYPLEVENKEFPTRRLQVDEKFVNPPADQLERIRKESRRLSAIFASVSDLPYWSGGFQSPVPGMATSGFGKRSILNGQPRSPHSGTDFDADKGTPVRNPNAGRVVLVEDLYYTGQTVVVDHGLALFSLFAHLSEFSVEVGQDVAQDEVLGRVGATGRVTGPHLHWTVRLATARVDPMALIAVTSEVGTEAGAQ